MKNQEIYQQKIDLIGGLGPYEVSRTQLTDDATYFPAVTYIDVVNYLINTKSAYSFEELKAYKSLEAFNQVYCGWVRDVCSMAVEDNVLVTGRVRHSQRMNETALKPWVIANKNGMVEAAHCDCMDGLGETCTHVGALLFYLESANRIVSRRTVTQEKAYWPLPASIDRVPYWPISDIEFTSAAAKKRKNYNEVNCENDCDTPTRSRLKLPDVPEPTPEEKEGIFDRLFHAKSNGSVLTVKGKYQKHFLPTILQDGQLPEPLINLRDEKYMDMPEGELQEACDTLFDNVQVTEQQAKKVQLLTREQGKCKEWHRLRMGRITASNMKAVCSTSEEKPAMSTVRAVCGITNLKKKATEYGYKHEQDALRAYSNQMRVEHDNFRVLPSGLCVNPSYPYMGASLEGLVSCDCCGEGLVEIKCPYSVKDSKLQDVSVECLDKNERLKTNHKYAYQRDYCDFVVWTQADMKIQRIEPNITLEEEILTKSKTFFRRVILPELAGSLMTRKENARTIPNKDVQPETAEKGQKIVNTENGQKKRNAEKYQKKELRALSTSTRDNKLETSKPTSVLAAPGTVCKCENRCDAKSDTVEKCDSENCQYRLLHFHCVNLKRRPKSPYYCPDCRMSMWK